MSKWDQFVHDTVLAVAYKDGWSTNLGFNSRVDTHGNAVYYGYYMCWSFDAPDAHTGVIHRQYSRQWMLDEGMNEDAIVKTCFAAALMAEEHEAREAFKYKGTRVFDPHIKVIA